MLEEWGYQAVYRADYQAKREIRALVPKNQVESNFCQPTGYNMDACVL